MRIEELVRSALENASLAVKIKRETLIKGKMAQIEVGKEIKTYHMRCILS